MGLKRIPLSDIIPNPDQPRKMFDPKALAELAANIAENGLMQPITVRPMGNGKYIIVAGERRWRAHCILADRGKLERDSILCHVRRMDDDQMRIEAIIENLMRTDITPLEEANAFQAALDHAGCTVEQLARKLGITQPRRIRERLHLLRLQPEIQRLLASDQISPSAAYEVARLEPHQQTNMVRRIAMGLVNINAIRAAVDTIVDGATQNDIFGGSSAVSDADVATLNRMERKIEQVEQLLAQGWKDGECIAASKVSPDRTELMADKITHMIKALRTMEKSLRETSIQVELILDATKVA